MGHHSSPACLGGHVGISRADRGASRPAARRVANGAATRDSSGKTLSVSLCLLAVRAYQAVLSPFLGGACRFYPSCSHYAREALDRHGARRGAWLSLRRLLRCQPFSAGGFDPVPPDAPARSAEPAS